VEKEILSWLISPNNIELKVFLGCFLLAIVSLWRISRLAFKLSPSSATLSMLNSLSSHAESLMAATLELKSSVSALKEEIKTLRDIRASCSDK
jgi:hypothetical protein